MNYPKLRIVKSKGEAFITPRNIQSATLGDMDITDCTNAIEFQTVVGRINVTKLTMYLDVEIVEAEATE